MASVDVRASMFFRPRASESDARVKGFILDERTYLSACSYVTLSKTRSTIHTMVISLTETEHGSTTATTDRVLLRMYLWGQRQRYTT